jgi:hypothetical protein
MSSTERDEIREVIAQTFVAVGTFARALHVEDARLEPTLNAITAYAAAAHPAVKDAGLILLIGGKLIPRPRRAGRPSSWTLNSRKRDAVPASTRRVTKPSSA